MSATRTRDRVFARGLLYGFLARTLRVPEADFAADLASAEFWRDLEEAGRTLRDHDVSAALFALRERAAGLDVECLAAGHRSAFGHTLRGAVPPYEVEYENKDIFGMTEALADLGGFYNAFGLAVDSASHERLDHAAVQLEFLWVLCAHQAEASEDASAEGVRHMAVVRDAQRKFLRDHLGRWGVAFARRLAAHEPEGFLGGVGRLLEAFLVQDCRTQALIHGPRFLELRQNGTPEEMLAGQVCTAPVPVPGAEEPGAEEEG